MATTAAAVKPGGRVITTLGDPTEFDRDVTAHYLGAGDGLGQLQDLVDQVASGKLRVAVTTYPLAKATCALAKFAVGHTQGRFVITL